MQTRRMIVALFASMAVFYIWLLVAQRIWPPQRPTTRPAPMAATQPGDNLPPGTLPAERGETRPAPAGATAPATAALSGGLPDSVTVTGGASDELLVLGNATADSPYPLALHVSPMGASVLDAYIREHYETVEKETPYKLLEPVTIDGTKLRSFTTTKIRFDNARLDVPLDDVLWAVAADEPQRKVLTATVEQDGRPLARVTKTYHLPRQPPDKRPEARTYDLDLSIGVENLTDQPVRVILEQQGPIGIRQEDQRTEDRRLLGANWLEGNTITVAGHYRNKVAPKVKMGQDEGPSRIAWGAETNKYFTCIMAPAGREGAQAAPVFASLEAVDLAGIASQTQSSDKPPSAATLQFVTHPLEIRPGASTEISFDVYLGPKSKRAFQSVPAYARLNYYEAIKESFYACAPAGLVALMMRLLEFFHSIVRNYGVAIIILVLMVRTILHPITKKSQVNMMKMQKQMSVLQPRVEAVKQKYANDRVAMNQAMMEVYRDAGVNPAGNLLTCLPLLLQIPIWGALWTALSSTIEMRHAAFDPWWIRDLAGPDAVIEFGRAYNIPLISWMAGPIHSLNILPVLLGISQLLQTKYMPRSTPAVQSATGQPDQFEQQRKMMMFMSGFFVLMLYNAPSGLNLYIMASNFFGILEQWRIRKHIAEEEKKEPAFDPERAKKAGPRKDTWIQRKWKELEKQVEEAKRLESQRPKKNK